MLGGFFFGGGLNLFCVEVTVYTHPTLEYIGSKNLVCTVDTDSFHTRPRVWRLQGWHSRALHISKSQVRVPRCISMADGHRPSQVWAAPLVTA